MICNYSIRVKFGGDKKLTVWRSDRPWEVLQAGGIGGEVTETQCLWTANNNVRQLDIAEQMPN